MHAPPPRTRAPFVLARLVLVILAFSACALSPALYYHQEPSAYYLLDTAPSALDVTVHVHPAGSYSLASFLFSVPGHLVDFREGETLACDGAAPVVLSSLRVGAEVAVSPTGVAAGDPFSCTYTSKGRSTGFVVRIPVPPEILTPAEGAPLTRAHAQPVMYQGITGSAKLVAWDHIDHSTSVTITDPDRMTIDTSAFVAGTGAIELGETPAVCVIAAGSFHSFTANCDTLAQINVVWY